jgi:uncharacterized membrane protein
MDIVFALITAVAYGLDIYFVRKGLLESPFPIKVVIVTPIATSYSLVTLLLSYLLLRKVERLSLKIVVATILIVGGVILLSLIK